MKTKVFTHTSDMEHFYIDDKPVSYETYQKELEKEEFRKQLNRIEKKLDLLINIKSKRKE